MSHPTLKYATTCLRGLALVLLLSTAAAGEDVGDQPPVKITAFTVTVVGSAK